MKSCSVSCWVWVNSCVKDRLFSTPDPWTTSKRSVRTPLKELSTFSCSGYISTVAREDEWWDLLWKSKEQPDVEFELRLHANKVANCHNMDGNIWLGNSSEMKGHTWNHIQSLFEGLQPAVWYKPNMFRPPNEHSRDAECAQELRWQYSMCGGNARNIDLVQSRLHQLM